MNDQAKHVPVVRLNSEVGDPVQRHLAVRIERVVGAMLPTHAGRPIEEITADMQTKLRGLGVTVAPRILEGYARAIANLPPAAA